MMDPVELLSVGIPVYRAIQTAGDFMITAPGAVHFGFNVSVSVPGTYVFHIWQ
jgi:hypothetical protein